MAYIYSNQEAAAGNGGFTREVLDDGVYDMKLVRITAYLKAGSAEYPDPQAKLRFTWAWVDENGELYENDEGRNYTVSDDMNMPKGFPEALSYHEKTTFYKKLSDICGTPITDQAAVRKIGIDTGDFVQTNAEILQVISSPMEGKPDRKGFVAVKGLAPFDVEQIGRICKIVVKKTPGKKDPSKFYNNVASIMQAQASQPKRPPVKQSTASQPLMTPPPAQRQANTTEPAHADLPY